MEQQDKIQENLQKLTALIVKHRDCAAPSVSKNSNSYDITFGADDESLRAAHKTFLALNSRDLAENVQGGYGTAAGLTILFHEIATKEIKNSVSTAKHKQQPSAVLAKNITVTRDPDNRYRLHFIATEPMKNNCTKWLGNAIFDAEIDNARAVATRHLQTLSFRRKPPSNAEFLEQYLEKKAKKLFPEETVTTNYNRHGLGDIPKTSVILGSGNQEKYAKLYSELKEIFAVRNEILENYAKGHNGSPIVSGIALVGNPERFINRARADMRNLQKDGFERE